MPDSLAFRKMLHHGLVFALTFAACLVACQVTVLGDTPKQAAAKHRFECAVRLQLILDGPRWIDGSLTAERGQFSGPNNLSMDPGTTGGLRIQERDLDTGCGTSLILQPGQAVDRLGVDVTYHGFHDDVLRLRLNLASGSLRPQRVIGGQSSSQERPSENLVELEISVSDLIRGVVDQELAKGVRLWVGRPGGDAMRVRVGDQKVMVFDAGQAVPLQVDLLAIPGLMASNLETLGTIDWSPDGKPNVVAPKMRSVDLRMELSNDATGEVAWQKSVAVNTSLHPQIYVGQLATAFAGQLELPDVEGVYTLKTKIVPSGNWRFVERLARPELLTRPDLITHPERLWNDEVIAERSTQMVVLEGKPAPADPTPLREIARWTPSQRNWLGLEPNAISTTHPIELLKHAGKTVARLAPESQLSQRIKTLAPGRPHILTVRYARDQPVKMSVAVRQQDAAGKWMTLGVDTAVVDDWSLDRFPESTPGSTSAYRVGEATSPEQQETLFAEHRLVFWPSTDQPMLVLRNENSRADLKIESISVQAGPSRLAGGRSGDLSNEEKSNKRIAAIYLDKPLLTEAFGCERQLDPSGRVALDDWTTFLQAGQRLVDHVQAAGANAAVIGGVSAGGTLYPTSHFTPTPRYDTGVFFSDGRDPIKKDVLELWLRLFERAGLQLVISLELATPLPKLEQLGQSEEGVGISWVDHLGREFLDYQPARRGTGVYYNVLDRRVEAEFTAIVDELVERYSRHSSLAGIGVQLGPNSMTQLPPSAFGRDERTLLQFRDDWDKIPSGLRTPGTQEVRVQQTSATESSSTHSSSLPRSTPALNSWLDGEGRNAWARWRTEKLTGVLQRLAKRLPEIPLVLITADYRPANLEVPGGDAIQAGLDWSTLAASPQIVPLRLIRRRLLVEPARRIEDARLNEDLFWDELLNEGVKPATAQTSGTLRSASLAFNQNSSTGGLLFFPPDPLPVSISESTGNQTELTLFPQAIAAPQQQVRELARFVDSMDSQWILVGGWTPSVAAESYTSAFYQSYTSLPRRHFHNVDPQNPVSSVVRVRQLQTESGLWIYAVNTAAWDMQVEIQTDAAAGTPVIVHGSNSIVTGIGASATAGSTPPAPNGLSQTWNGRLQPGQLVVIEVQGRTRGIARWNAVPVVDPFKEIAARIDDLAARVAILGEPRRHGGLVNGSFETVKLPDDAQHNLPQIEGWMRSQHPPDCVRTTSHAVDGKQALVLKTDDSPGARTWLLSSPLQAPETGRLALSIRAKSITGAPTLRVAIEGRVRGSAIRYSVNVQPEASSSSNKQIPGTNPNGSDKLATDWSPQAYWLYVTDLPDEDIEDLRIAIDLVTPGEVAIDDVQLFDFFFTQRERNELQRQTFVAAERLRRGDMLASTRLLDSHWARYLRWLEMPSQVIPTSETSSQVQANAANSNAAASGVASGSTSPSPASGQSWRNADAPAVPPAKNVESPSFADRIRQYLPEPLRF